ncbi:MAG: SRPBCC family protein [Devosia sp.]
MSIVIKTSIDINAPAKDVWAVLTDVPVYGEWSNFCKIDGVAQAGTKLAMKMPGMSFGSTATAAAPDQKLEWAATRPSPPFHDTPQWRSRVRQRPRAIWQKSITH